MTKKDIFYLKTKKTDAKGVRIIENEFLLLKGSKINDKISPSLQEDLKIRRKNSIKGGKVKNNITTIDMPFSSVSAAAKFVVGYSTNGWVSWKNKDGKTMKELDF